MAISMDSATKKLTAKQQRFVEEYVVDLNATQAAIRAGYSPKTARQMGAENLSKPYIQEAIQALMSEQSKETELTVDSVLKQLGEDREFAIKQGKPASAVRVTELLGKHIGMFPSKHEISGPDGGPVVTDDLSGMTNEEIVERIKVLDTGKGS